MTNLDFDETFKNAQRSATEHYRERGSITPMFYGHNLEDNSIHAITFAAANETEMQALIAFVRTYNLVNQIEFYTMVTECYMARIPMGQPRPPGRVEDMPGRIEVLNVTAVSRQRKAMHSWEVKDGKLIDLDIETPDAIEGRLLNLLPPRNMVCDRAHMVIARALLEKTIKRYQPKVFH